MKISNEDYQKLYLDLNFPLFYHSKLHQLNIIKNSVFYTIIFNKSSNSQNTLKSQKSTQISNFTIIGP